MLNRFLYILIFALVSSGVKAESSALSFGSNLFTQPEFLPVDEAFVFTSQIEDGFLRLHWEITDEYYLYHDRFKVSLGSDNATLGNPTFEGARESKEDPYFGIVQVYHNEVAILQPVSLNSGDEASVKVTYQGCAEAGLCYPPQTKEVLYIGEPASTDLSSKASNRATVDSKRNTAARPGEESNLESASGIFDFMAQNSLAATFGIFFLLGLGLTFTPCVFPMIPIISSVIAGEKNPTLTRSFVLSLSYVLGMALTYAAAGVVTGLLGAQFNVQAAMQAPAVLITFAAVFVALSFAMFGFYELQLPAAIRDRLNTTSQSMSGGKLASVFVIGALSALVVSPCVSAPLAGALLYISTTADAMLGGAALFALGLGMGVPLMIVGVSGGTLLPKAGIWMDTVKKVFGVMMLAIAAWLVERLLPASAALLMWALLVGGAAIYMGALEPAASGWQKLWKTCGVFMLAYALTLFLGAVSGAEDPLDPLAKLTGKATTGETSTEVHFRRISEFEELQTALKEARESNQPVMLDYYADWCISCKIMERDVFSHPQVAPRLDNLLLLQADVTDSNPDTLKLLEHYNLFGPPSILFFAASGEELDTLRVLGEMNREQFSSHLDRVFSVL